MKALLDKYLIPTIISAASVFAPIKGVIITVGVVIVVDLITGVLAAKKRGEKITSAGLRRSLSKALIYQTAVLTGFLMEKYLLADIVPITKLVAGAIGAVESISIFENLNTLSGNNLFSKILEVLGSVNDKKKGSEEPPKE
jgi:phage-related holin